MKEMEPGEWVNNICIFFKVSILNKIFKNNNLEIFYFYLISEKVVTIITIL